MEEDRFKHIENLLEDARRDEVFIHAQYVRNVTFELKELATLFSGIILQEESNYSLSSAQLTTYIALKENFTQTIQKQLQHKYERALHSIFYLRELNKNSPVLESEFITWANDLERIAKPVFPQWLGFKDAV